MSATCNTVESVAAPTSPVQSRLDDARRLYEALAVTVSALESVMAHYESSMPLADRTSRNRLIAQAKEVLNSTMVYNICSRCDHFVDADGHLDDGEQEYDHYPAPVSGSPRRTLPRWKEIRPDLFLAHPDGKIGPNSRYHGRRGKRDAYVER